MSHKAALMKAKATPFEVETVSTPRPGPGECLVGVKVIAINPVDRKQREAGFFIDSYPAVLGSDISGTVLEFGTNIPSGTPFKVGDRVTAYAPEFYKGGAPRYGAFQQKVIVPVTHVAQIPDSLDLEKAATIPMSAVTAWAGFFSMGLPYNYKVTPSEKKGLLVWGASSSIGCTAIQVGRDMGFTVFATASLQHEAGLKKIGAKEVVDYKDPNCVATLVQMARSLGVSIKLAYFATGSLRPPCDVVAAFDGGIVAQAPALPAHAPEIPGVRVVHIHGPSEEAKLNEHFRFVFHDYVSSGLVSGKFVPASTVRVYPGGLRAINEACDLVFAGVSGEKVVIHP